MKYRKISPGILKIHKFLFHNFELNSPTHIAHITIISSYLNYLLSFYSVPLSSYFIKSKKKITILKRNYKYFFSFYFYSKKGLSNATEHHPTAICIVFKFSWTSGSLSSKKTLLHRTKITFLVSVGVSRSSNKVCLSFRSSCIVRKVEKINLIKKQTYLVKCCEFLYLIKKKKIFFYLK